MPTLTKKHFEAVAQTVAKNFTRDIKTWIKLFEENNPNFSRELFIKRVRFLVRKKLYLKRQ